MKTAIQTRPGGRHVLAERGGLIQQPTDPPQFTHRQATAPLYDFLRERSIMSLVVWLRRHSSDVQSVAS